MNEIKRVDIKALLANPYERRRLIVNSIIAIQARESITTTVEQAEAAYDAIRKSGHD